MRKTSINRFYITILCSNCNGIGRCEEISSCCTDKNCEICLGFFVYGRDVKCNNCNGGINKYKISYTDKISMINSDVILDKYKYVQAISYTELNDILPYLLDLNLNYKDFINKMVCYKHENNLNHILFDENIKKLYTKETLNFINSKNSEKKWNL